MKERSDKTQFFDEAKKRGDFQNFGFEWAGPTPIPPVGNPGLYLIVDIKSEILLFCLTSLVQTDRELRAFA